MIFLLFAVVVAALFFIGSLPSLNLGRHLGLRYCAKRRTDGMAGLPTAGGPYLV